MLEPFDLEWLGGVSERYFRKLRPGVDELPWGTLDPARYPAALVDRARVSWTEAAYNEYCTAAGFSQLLGALLAAKAPLDLIGMASDFVADEVLHVELTSRVAMELGGGAPYEVDFATLALELEASRSPLERAAELVVRLCCVGEAFSLPMLASAYESATHPLTKGVLQRIVHDEAPHGRFGWLFLDWARDELDAGARSRLGVAALDTLRALAPLWQRLTTGGSEYDLAQIRELGWTEAGRYAVRARDAVAREVVAPLASHGIVIPAEQLAALLR